MTTFLTSTIIETAKTDDNRLEMTFVDAGGKRYTVSIPSAVAADLVPLLEHLAAESGADDGRTDAVAESLRGWPCRARPQSFAALRQ